MGATPRTLRGVWAWIIIWLLIAAFGGAWLFLLAREVYRKAVRLFDEVEAASVGASDAAAATTTS